MIRPPRTSKPRGKSSTQPNPSRSSKTSKESRDKSSAQPVPSRPPKKNKSIVPLTDDIIGSFDDHSSPDNGFIILRHVRSRYTNAFWIRCYKSVRKYHPDSRICIIDDGSDTDCVKREPLPNTIIVFSAYKHRGEFLPYYYMLKNDWFNKAVIIHDSTYLNQPFDFTVDKYKFLWNFKASWDRINHVKQLMSRLNNSKRLIEYYDSNNNIGCFGAMTIIERSFLVQVDEVYSIEKLLDTINTRSSRMDFERVLGGMLLSIHTPEDVVAFGDIHEWQKWGRTYEKLNERDKNLPIVKYWCGR